MGGRQVRKDADQLFDHYSAEYTFPDGTRFVGEGRHMTSCFDFWGAVLQGAKGSAILGEGQDDPRLFKGWNQTSENLIWRYKGPKCDKYQYEHDLLFDAIRNDKPYNESERCAKTSLTCIMGRMACESGKKITWEEAMASERRAGARTGELHVGWQRAGHARRQRPIPHRHARSDPGSLIAALSNIASVHPRGVKGGLDGIPPVQGTRGHRVCRVKGAQGFIGLDRVGGFVDPSVREGNPFVAEAQMFGEEGVNGLSFGWPVIVIFSGKMHVAHVVRAAKELVDIADVWELARGNRLGPVRAAGDDELGPGSGQGGDLRIVRRILRPAMNRQTDLALAATINPGRHHNYRGGDRDAFIHSGAKEGLGATARRTRHPHTGRVGVGQPEQKIQHAHAVPQLQSQRLGMVMIHLLALPAAHHVVEERQRSHPRKRGGELLVVGVEAVMREMALGD